MLTTPVPQKMDLAATVWWPHTALVTKQMEREPRDTDRVRSWLPRCAMAWEWERGVGQELGVRVQGFIRGRAALSEEGRELSAI